MVTSETQSLVVNFQKDVKIYTELLQFPSCNQRRRYFL
jgi:hypothetical protein